MSTLEITPAVRAAFAPALARLVGPLDQCWPWDRAVQSSGYGCVGIFGRTYLVHRLAFELVKGRIPADLTIDHTCRNRRCVNPAHLEAVTRELNSRRRFKRPCKTYRPPVRSSLDLAIDGWIAAVRSLEQVDA